MTSKELEKLKDMLWSDDIEMKSLAAITLVTTYRKHTLKKIFKNDVTNSLHFSNISLVCMINKSAVVVSKKKYGKQLLFFTLKGRNDIGNHETVKMEEMRTVCKDNNIKLIEL